MRFTGERYIPSLDGQIKYEHLHRYALSLGFVTGKSVLDIASGEGYGSVLLARVAQSVVGVDIEPECIEYARQKYSGHSNLNFLLGSCDSVPLQDQSVEVVTSFETIEHHNQHEQMMLEIKRVLKPGGILIISSPDRLTYSDQRNYSNPFHIKELYYDELVGLLSRHFKYVQLYGQRIATGSFVFSLEDSNETSLNAYTCSGNQVTQKVCCLDSPTYFVAICSDEAISTQQTINSVYIDSSDDLLKALETSCYEARVALKQLQSQLQASQAELERLRLQLQENQEVAIHTSIKRTPISVPKRINYPLIETVSKDISRPSWSVMIPSYNGTKYLEQTLKSVLEQDPGANEMQIEVIDDCSINDDPEALVKEIGKGRVQFYRQPRNVGLAANWNTCIQRARGHWVHILHQDDIVLPGFYSRLQEATEKEPTVGAVFCRYINIDENGHWQSLGWLERETPGILLNFLEQRLAIFNPLRTPGIIVRRSVYEQLGGFLLELIYAVDWEMWKRIVAHYPVWYEPQPLVCYREHSSSETSRLVRSGATVADMHKAIEISEEYLPKPIAAELSSKSREFNALDALNTARRLLYGGDMSAAIAQIREGLKCSDSLRVISSLASLLPESEPLLRLVASRFLSSMSDGNQSYSQIEFDLRDINLREINWIVFPDWSQPEESINSDLAPVIRAILSHPDRVRMTLLVDNSNISEEDANLILSDITMNLLMEEDFEVSEEPEITLIGELSELQWEALLPRVHVRIVLEHENKQAIALIKAEKIPACELHSLNSKTYNASIS